MIKVEDIQYRIDRVVDNKVIDNKGATLLVYIDARTARKELNEKFGFGNWQFSYTVNEDKSVHGVLKVHQRKSMLAIMNEDKKAGRISEPEWDRMYEKLFGIDGWLEFHDVGYCSNSYSNEPLKDAVSDATKRCAVQVGIGAFLYDAPFLWATWDQLKINSKGKPTGLTDDGDKIIRGRIESWYKNLFPDKGDLDIRQINS